MSPAEFKNLLDRYFHGECSPEEVAFIEKWYDEVDSNDPLSPSGDLEVKQRIWAKVKPVRTISPWVAPSSKNYLKYAAIMLLLIVAAIAVYKFSDEEPTKLLASKVTITTLPNSEIETRNTTGAAHAVTLSDGSEIILEPNSLLRYPKTFSSNERRVELIGEAFFKVKRDVTRPFIVHSNELVTKVLGTSFRISAFEGSKEIVVAVKTGKVAVQQKNISTTTQPSVDVILTPNQQLVYSREQKQLVKQVVPEPTIVVADSSAYYNMQFDGMPVTEIFDALEKNYGIKIAYDKEMLDACVLTTKMTEEGFYERIDVICKAINAEYTSTDGAVYIKSKGCR